MVTTTHANVVYVIGYDGQPLSPTIRFGRVRHLLKDKKAKIISYRPFVIQLRYEKKTYVKPMTLGIDCGRTNIGAAVIERKENTAAVVYSSHVETRSKEIPKLMEERKAHRRASRNGERKVRQRRAVKCGQSRGTFKRYLPQCEEPITLHHIKNTEAKFCNRKRKPGWVTPSVRHVIQTHLNYIASLQKFLPIGDIVIELNPFSFMEMEHGKLYGLDFQNGRMKGYDSVEDYIYALQGGKCIFCDNQIDAYHHMLPKSKAGSNRPENITGVCNHHHKLVHTDVTWSKKLLAFGDRKKYAALSVLNQAIPFIYRELVNQYGENHIHTGYGYQTKEARERLELPKDHHYDAVAMVCSKLEGTENVVMLSETYQIKQFRRHDRSRIKAQRERTYKLNGKVVAKNRRKRFEQTEPSLHEFYLTMKAEYGKQEARQIQSQLQVIKSIRYYNDPDRIMPGAVFLSPKDGKRHVMSGQLSNGQYLRAVGDSKTNHPTKTCKILKYNTGLVYL